MKSILQAIENTELQRVSAVKLSLKTFLDISSTTLSSVESLHVSLGKSFDLISAMDDLQQYINENTSIHCSSIHELNQIYQDAGEPLGNLHPLSSTNLERVESNRSLPSETPTHQQQMYQQVGG